MDVNPFKDICLFILLLPLLFIYYDFFFNFPWISIGRRIGNLSVSLHFMFWLWDGSLCRQRVDEYADLSDFEICNKYNVDNTGLVCKFLFIWHELVPGLGFVVKARPFWHILVFRINWLVTLSVFNIHIINHEGVNYISGSLVNFIRKLGLSYMVWNSLLEILFEARWE